jgi:hypothetical protein
MTKRQSKFLKVAGLQISIILAVLITQAVMVFFSQNKILVIVPKNDEKSFYGLYATAKADYLTCDEELKQVKAEKQFCIESNNQDIMGE